LDEASNVAVGFTGSESSDSNDGTDDHDPSTEGHHLSSTELLSGEEGEQGSEETSD
jgi:hypothetical protein